MKLTLNEHPEKDAFLFVQYFKRYIKKLNIDAFSYKVVIFN